MLFRQKLCFVQRKRSIYYDSLQFKKKKRQTEMTWRAWEALVILSDPLDLNVLL